MKSMMMKAKEEPATSTTSQQKYASLEINSPKVSVSTRISEAQSTKNHHFAYNIYNARATSATRESYTIDDGKDSNANVRVSRQAKPQHERYRDHSNYFNTETSKERSESSSRRINTEPANDLRGRYKREEYGIANNHTVAQEPTLKVFFENNEKV